MSISKYDPPKKFKLLKPINIEDENTGKVILRLKANDVLTILGFNHDTYSEVFEFNGKQFEFSTYNINDVNIEIGMLEDVIRELDRLNGWSPDEMYGIYINEGGK